MTDKIKLHLACGDDYQEGWINVDLYNDKKVDAKFDVSEVPYPDNSVDEIKAFHIIEHFDWYKGQDTLKEWFRVLKPGGRLWLETPDLFASCKAFAEGSHEFQLHLYGHFFSTAWIPGQAHLFLFTEVQLRTQLEWAGFSTINRIAPSSKYLAHYPAHIFLCMEATK